MNRCVLNGQRELTAFRCLSIDEEPITLLTTLSAAGIDYEVRAATTTDDLQHLLLVVHDMFRQRRYLELAEAVLRLLLQAHGDVLVQSPPLVDLLQTIQALHGQAWDKTQGMFQHALCLLNFFSGRL